MAASYVAEQQGALPENPWEYLTMTEAFILPAVPSMNGQQGAKFLHILEVYVEDFIQLEQIDEKEELRRCSWALLHGIHSVFPPPSITRHVGKELVSMKN